jgi:hypothetical protein
MHRGLRAAHGSRVQAVNGNGSRRPPRPKIELVAGNPTEQEAAAVVAALEQFLAELAPEPAARQESRWQRAALSEGVNREPRTTRWGTQL